MAVYKQGPEIWKPFEGYAQAGKSGDVIVEDGTTNEDPVFVIDWNTGKFRDSSGFTGVSQDFDVEINTSNLLLSKSAHFNTTTNQTPQQIFQPSDELSKIWMSTQGEYTYTSFWFKVEQEYASNNAGHSLVVFQAGDQKYTVYYDGDTKQIGFNWIDELLANNEIDLQTSVPGGLEPNNWHHVVLRLRTPTHTVSYVRLTAQDPNERARVWINGFEVTVSVTDGDSSGTTTVTHDSTEVYVSFGGRGYIGLGNLEQGFIGSLGNFNVMSSARPDIANLLYRLDRWGASKPHSGIHSFGERLQLDQLESNIHYPPHFGGLTSSNTGLGSDPFLDSIDISWNDQRPIGSYLYSSSAMPYTKLSGQDPLLNGRYKSPTKSLFFSEDLTDFEIDSYSTKQELYLTVPQMENTNHLAFDDTTRIGQDTGDKKYRDTTVIDIPLNISVDTLLGSQNKVVIPIANTEISTIENTAYYNFQTGEFEPITYTINQPPFSPGQGVTVEPEKGWDWTWKNLARPQQGGQFPVGDLWHQDLDKTLDLSGYLKDDFILEGYELILEFDHTETTTVDHSISAFGLGHRLGGLERTNDFGVAIDQDSLGSSDGRRAFATKIFTSFLLREKPYSTPSKLRDDSTVGFFAKGFGAASRNYEDGDGLGNYGFGEERTWSTSGEKVGDGWEANGLGLGFIGTATVENTFNVSNFNTGSTERELISYGQTVLVTDGKTLKYAPGKIDKVEWSEYGNAARAYDFEWYFSTDAKGILKFNDDIGQGKVSSVSELLSDREQIVVYENIQALSSGTVTMEQIVPVHTNSLTKVSIPTKELKLGIHLDGNTIDEVFRSSRRPIFFEDLYLFYYYEVEVFWNGGSDPYADIENRMIPSVIGASDPVAMKTSQRLPVDPFEFGSAAIGSYHDFNNDPRLFSREMIGSADPKQSREGYILRPNDKLILGIMNSQSQVAGSYWNDLIDEQTPPSATPNWLHENQMTIKSKANSSVQPRLRLFGRYKRNDKFQVPTENLSLFHNASVNEPIGSEDIVDQFLVEERASYIGSTADDIMGDDTEADVSITVTAEFADYDYGTYGDPMVNSLRSAWLEIYDNRPSSSLSDPNISINWKDLNSKLFPGVGLDINGQQTSAEDGVKLAPYLGWIQGGGQPFVLEPVDRLTIPTVLRFLTSDSSKMWNTYTWTNPFGTTQEYHMRKGGEHIQELSLDGYDISSDPDSIGGAVTLTVWDSNTSSLVSETYQRDVQNFPSCTFETSSCKHSWQYVFAFNVLDANQGVWSQKLVRFIPVVIDADSPPADSLGTPFQTGEAFYFDGKGDDANNGSVVKISISNTPSWSLHFPNNPETPLNLFIVVGDGTATKTTDLNGGDALPNGLEIGSEIWFNGLSVFAIDTFNTVYSLQELYENIIYFIKVECDSNPSLLLSSKQDYLETQEFSFFVSPETIDYFEQNAQAIEDSLQAINGNKRSIVDEDRNLTNTVFTPEDFEGQLWAYSQFYDSVNGFVAGFKQVGTVDLSDWPTASYTFEKFDSALADLYTATAPSDPKELAAYETNIRRTNRRVVSRSAGETVLDSNGQEIDVLDPGLLGALKKHVTLVDDSFIYHDTLSKIHRNFENRTPDSWIYIGHAVDPDLSDYNIKVSDLTKRGREIDTEVTSIWNTDANTREWLGDGLYSRLSFYNTNGSLVWPPQDAPDETTTLPLVDWVKASFPFLYPENSILGKLSRGLGSEKNRKIKVFPIANKVPAWTDVGPTESVGSFQMEPLRGSRWGTMHPTDFRRQYYFSGRNYGQPVYFFDSGVDGLVDPNEAAHDNGQCNGPAVLIRWYDRQDPSIEKPADPYTKRALQKYAYKEPDDIGEDQNSDVEDSNVTTTDSLNLGNNLRVDVVGSIAKRATISPGQIINRRTP
jgi:hypothetical protein